MPYCVYNCSTNRFDLFCDDPAANVLHLSARTLVVAEAYGIGRKQTMRHARRNCNHVARHGDSASNRTRWGDCATLKRCLINEAVNAKRPRRCSTRMECMGDRKCVNGMCAGESHCPMVMLQRRKQLEQAQYDEQTRLQQRVASMALLVAAGAVVKWRSKLLRTASCSAYRTSQ